MAKARPFKTARDVVNLRQGRNDWYKIKNQDAAGGAVQVHIYDEIGYFGVTAEDFVSDLRALDTSSIELHINSPGGEVFEALTIYNSLKNLEAEITVYIDGLAASAASFIAMAGDKVIAERNSQMMIHDGHGLAVGNAQDMRELADLLDKTSNNIADIYQQKAGKDVEFWRTAMRAETWYNAQEALDAGLVDEINEGKSKSDTTNTWDLSIFKFSGRDAAPNPKEPPSLSENLNTFDPEALRNALKEAIK